jgi:type 1 fimbria pilin
MANLAALNAATEGVLVQAGDTFDVSVSGTFVATVSLQRSKDNAIWFTVEDMTAPAQKTGSSGSAWYYRLAATAYTSGTVVADIWK